MEITQNTTAWLSSLNANTLEKLAHPHNFDLNTFHFVDPDLDMSEFGWVKIGKAVLTVDMRDPNETKALAVTALKDQIEEVTAKYHAAVTELKDRINNLLSLSMSEPFEKNDIL